MPTPYALERLIKESNSRKSRRSPIYEKISFEEMETLLENQEFQTLLRNKTTFLFYAKMVFIRSLGDMHKEFEESGTRFQDVFKRVLQKTLRSGTYQTKVILFQATAEKEPSYLTNQDLATATASPMPYGEICSELAQRIMIGELR